jgi:hypothetical protein
MESKVLLVLLDHKVQKDPEEEKEEEGETVLLVSLGA